MKKGFLQFSSVFLFVFLFLTFPNFIEAAETAFVGPPTEKQVQDQKNKDATAAFQACVKSGSKACAGNDSYQNGGTYGSTPTQTAPTNLVAAVAGAGVKIGVTFGIQAAMQAIQTGVVASAVAASAPQAALSVPVYDASGTLLAAKQAAHGITDDIHQFTLRGVARILADTIIHEISRSLVTWINSGFNGGPAFITDPQGFLINTGDQVSGAFIAGAGLNALCQPFNLQIRLALAQNRGGGGGGGYQCTLSKAIQNVQNFNSFVSGSFSSNGGWNSWFSLTQNNANNPYGAYIESSNALEQIVTSKLNSEIKKLDWGQGFHSKVVCDGKYIPPEGDTGSQDNDGISKGQSSCDHMSIVTPGSVLREQINASIGSDLVSLENVHDINEIVNALVGQLVNVVVTSANGLSGASEPSRQKKRPDGSTYNISLVDETVGAINPQVLANIKEPVLKEIEAMEAAIMNPTNIFNTQTVFALKTAQNNLYGLMVCYSRKIPAPGSTDFKGNAEIKFNEASTTLYTVITPYLQGISLTSSTTIAMLLPLEEVKRNLIAAETLKEVNSAIDAFQKLREDPRYQPITQTQVDAQIAANTVNAEAGAKFRECEAYGPNISKGIDPNAGPNGSSGAILGTGTGNNGNGAGIGNYNGDGTYNFGTGTYETGNPFYDGGPVFQ